jgi:hypothetical protein
MVEEKNAYIKGWEDTDAAVGKTLDDMIDYTIASAFDEAIALAALKSEELKEAVEAILGPFESESHWARDMGKGIAEGLAVGMGQFDAANFLPRAGPTTTNQTTNRWDVSMGPITIANGMDMRTFEARVLRVVTKAARYG